MSSEKNIKITQKGSCYYISGPAPKPIKIPSQMYPVHNKVCVFSNANTEPFPDCPQTDKIKEIYDSITPGVGTCYTNTEKLIDSLAAEGIQAIPYVGWVFVGGDLPVHHCFAVIGNHLLDFNPNFQLMESELPKDLSIEQARDAFTDQWLELRKLPNSETTIFGRSAPYALYFASPCKPQDGLSIYMKLMRSFPKHPCYRNIVDGTNKTQKMLLQKQGLL